MSHKKTTLSIQAVQTLLNEHIVGTASRLQPLVEGEESQAFEFMHDDQEYVIRINRSARDFYKDAYAYQHFASKKLPIPSVSKIGYFVDKEGGEQLTFCITEKMPGMTLQDTDARTLQSLLKPTFDVWNAIRNVDISNTDGFGDFDETGRGKYQSWQAFLLSSLDNSSHNWRLVAQQVGSTFLDELVHTFSLLLKDIQFEPKERSLVHGDFGSNNVLTNGTTITAILDWGNAMYGDPLYDIAGAYFWRTWLYCMDVQATYYEEHLSTMPHYHTRLKCYQLFIALNELYDNVIHPNTLEIEWYIERARDILQN